MPIKSDLAHAPYDVVGIGNAIVDILIKTNDSFLEINNLKKGSMSLIDEDQAQKLYLSIGPGIESSGGSAANTLAGIAQLGGKAGFIGRVKDDQLGKIFTNDICSVGAFFNTPAAKNGPSTARCIIFVTPDAQRTMCTYLGASVMLEPENLNLSMVKQAKVLYLEGYLWDNSSAKNAFIFGAKTCKESGGQVALSLSDSFCVERHRKSFIELVDNHIDILFANDAEIKALYQVKQLESALDIIKGRCNVAVITKGEQGSVILTEENLWEIESYKFGPVIDTTGAGDLYAGGFLYGYTQGEELLKCGHYGSICAGKIVTQIGPRSNNDLKTLLDKARISIS